MKDKKILLVSSDVSPYMPGSKLSSTVFNTAKFIHSKGGQTRIFMPRYGLINERRHQLHEVIRLSGMNLVINDVDMPLIIKVASIPKERMQVYFIDNEEYFKRKAQFSDAKDKLFKDNDERIIFFAKGVIETVKKLNWAPDIIHVHGWFSSLLPLYISEYCKNDALFVNSKIVASLCDNPFEGSLGKNLLKKVEFDHIDKSLIEELGNPTHTSLNKIVIKNADVVVKPENEIDQDLEVFLKNTDKKVFEHTNVEDFESVYSHLL